MTQIWRGRGCLWEWISTSLWMITSISLMIPGSELPFPPSSTWWIMAPKLFFAPIWYILAMPYLMLFSSYISCSSWKFFFGLISPFRSLIFTLVDSWYVYLLFFICPALNLCADFIASTSCICVFGGYMSADVFLHHVILISHKNSVWLLWYSL